MQRKPNAIALFLGLCLSPVAFAQQSGQSDNPHQGSAASQQDSQQQSGQKSAQASQHPPVAIQTIVVAGTIDAIDRDKRTVTLRGDDGQTVTIRAGEDVKDFDKLKKGQPIVARYTEAYALEMKKGANAQQSAQGSQQDSTSAQPSAQASQQGSQSQQAQASQSSQASQNQAANSQAGGSAQQSGGSSTASSTSQPSQGGQPMIGQVERLTVFGRVAQVDKQANRVIVQVPNGDMIRLKVKDQQAMSDFKRGDDVAVTYVQASATELKPSSSSDSDSAQRNDSQQSGGTQQQ